MADQSGGGGGSAVSTAMAASGSGTGGLIMREYRKGNWTFQETMILIEAKMMDDERRLKRSASAAGSGGSLSSEQQQMQQQLTPGSSSSSGFEMRNKPGELRWKWVEDYCWRRGCFRSQNQCNDKWDNLMRDYKKVRDYERKLLLDQNAAAGGGASSSSATNVSYWNMEKSERKQRGLPSNMLPAIYEALVEVVEKKSAAAAAASTSSPTLPAAPIGTVKTSDTDVIMTVHNLQQPTAALSLLHQQHLNAASAVAALALPPPPPQQPPHAAQPIQMYQIPIPESLDSDTSSDSPAKRRRKDKGPESTAGPGPSTSTNEAADVVASAISKGATKIAEAIQASDNRREMRHSEMLELNQRRLIIEESNMEVNRQGMSRLVDAMNNLANSISSLAAASNSRHTAP